ncbi:hypothetical protein Bxe_B0003 [Paraburkholderia xenovorans LB400]|uniref:Uncharacterized protein n=1 Tax=Paraburkholderia xenovorans (strain LB400) TaxID=266265 RepID=Q13J18_PARXL|nr:hypothetical protein Bxe_B0003 [Paraburkholderia xenovorans LB400]
MRHHHYRRLDLPAAIHAAAATPHFLATFGQFAAAMHGVRFRTVDGHLTAGLLLRPLLFFLAGGHRFIVGLSCVVETHGWVLRQVDLFTYRLHCRSFVPGSFDFRQSGTTASNRLPQNLLDRKHA